MWHLLCSVVDHFGDAGVALRLSRALCGLNQPVVLWCDCPSLVLKMLGNEKIKHFQLLELHEKNEPYFNLNTHDVLVELFSFPLPFWVNQKIENNSNHWVWLQVEYLGLEEWVIDCHLKPSPQKKGRIKYFYFPSIFPNAGALNFEKNTIQKKENVSFSPFKINYFVYQEAYFNSLLECVKHKKNIKINNFNHSQHFIAQKQFDALLRSAQLNIVRGEDSFVQAIFAQQPFIWQAYIQEDQAHFAKVESFLSVFLPFVPTDLQRPLGNLFRFVNGMIPHFQAWDGLFLRWHNWQRSVRCFAQSLTKPKNLAEELVDFVDYLKKKRS